MPSLDVPPCQSPDEVAHARCHLGSWPHPCVMDSCLAGGHTMHVVLVRPNVPHALSLAAGTYLAPSILVFSPIL